MSLLNKFYTTTTHYLFMFPTEKIPPWACIVHPAREPLATAEASLRRMEKELGYKLLLIEPGELIYFVKEGPRDNDPDHSMLVISGERTGWIWASMYRFNITPVVVEEE